jgi:hypothetical protein
LGSRAYRRCRTVSRCFAGPSRGDWHAI